MKPVLIKQSIVSFDTIEIVDQWKSQTLLEKLKGVPKEPLHSTFMNGRIKYSNCEIDFGEELDLSDLFADGLLKIPQIEFEDGLIYYGVMPFKSVAPNIYECWIDCFSTEWHNVKKI